MRRTTIIATLSLSCSLTLQAHEFTGGHYPSHDLDYKSGDICDSARFVDTPGDCSGSDASNPNWVVEFETAQARWNTATDFFDLSTSAGQGASTPGTCSSSDPNSTFFLVDACGTAFGGSTVAVARTFGFADGVSTHSDIIFKADGTVTWRVFDDGFINHPGETDFRRVAVHELGHTMGLNHPYTTDAIMYFASQSGVIGPMGDDLQGIKSIYGILTFLTASDFSGNAEPELVAVRSDDTGTVQVDIRDSAAGTLLESFAMDFDGSVHVPVDAVMLPDVDADGNQEIAVLTRRLPDGRGRIEIKNVDGTGKRFLWLTASATPKSMIAIPDADTNGRWELGVLQERNFDSRLYVEINNSFFGAMEDPLVNRVFLPPFADGFDLELVDDADGDGTVEVAVLTRRWSDGRYIVDVRNVVGLPDAKRIFAAANVTAIAIAEVNDADDNGIEEIAILATLNSNGRSVVQVKNASGMTLTNNIFFQGGKLPRAITVIDSDADGDGNPEIAVLSRRTADGRVLVETRNADEAHNASFVWFPADMTPYPTLSIIEHANPLEDPDAAVFLYRMSNGNTIIQARDVDGLGSPVTVSF